MFWLLLLAGGAGLVLTADASGLGLALGDELGAGLGEGLGAFAGVVGFGAGAAGLGLMMA